MSIGHSELLLEQFEIGLKIYSGRNRLPLFAPLIFFSSNFKKLPVIDIPFIVIRQKEFLNFIEKHGRYELLNVKKISFFGER